MTALPDAIGPVTPVGPDTAPALTAEARALVEALARKSLKTSRAIDMYLEARRAMAKGNQESLHVAGYEIREFMNALPRALDLPIVPREQMKDRIQAIVLEYKEKTRNSACFSDGEWDGSLDEHLERLVRSLMKFVKWLEQHVPSRRVEAMSVLQRLAPTEHPYPAALMNVRADEWKELLRYFNGCTHHDGDPDPAEFGQRVESLERFLLDHLEPRTFEDQDEIDRLIKEVEKR